MHGGTEVWAHNPVHRRGVAYHNPETARRFGQTERPGVAARQAFRGFAPESRGAGVGISPPARPDTGRQMRQPQSRQVVQPQKGNAFESFGASGREVIQHSERGHSSIGGGGRSSAGSHGGGGGGGSHGGGGKR